MTTTRHDPYAPAPPEIAARVREIMRLPYRRVLTPLDEGGFLARIPDFDGCQADGATEQEALAELALAEQGWLESKLMHGDLVPDPSPDPATTTYSGKVLIRMPKTLHRQLMERAEAEGVSANQLAVVLLAKGL